MKHLLAALCLMCCAHAAQALNLTGVPNAHDPGTLTRDGDTYFNFTTGNGIWYSSSTDMLNWSAGPAPVFSTPPAWIANKIPNFSGSYWAPDVIHMNGYYYLYYSVSTFGTSVSAIGVARSASLKNPAWTDLGIVVQSYGGGAEINAIDPALFRDYDGKVYLSYGSFFGGIGVTEINQATGKTSGNVTTILGGGGKDIEAPYITRDGEYYYLFVNRGKCCQGAASTYYVEVQRASSVTGPYSGTRTALPNLDGKYKGPGHIGVLKQDGCNYTSVHYYDVNDNGAAKLDILKMTYSGGWPSLTRNFTGARHQQWYVVGHGDGYYSLINANSLLGLDDYNNSTTAGTHIAQWSYWGGLGQQWRFASPASGYQTITNRYSNLTLDVLNLSTAENAQIIQWNLTNANNQQWSLSRP